MKVYIVHYRDGYKEIDDIVGVYSSEEKAEKAIAELKEDLAYREGWFSITEWTLDE